MKSRAFTLIELMVATAITSLLLLGMTGIFDQAMKAWQLSSRRGDAEREIRAALGTLQRDLGGLAVTSNLPMYLGVTDANLVGISSSNRPNLAPTNASGTWSNVSSVLFFATTQGGNSGSPGDLSAVGYYVAWSPNDNGGRGAYNLYRFYRSPSSFYSNGITNFLANSNRLYQANNQDEVIGANILNFWAQPVLIVSSPAGINPTNLPNGPIVVRPQYIQMELTAYGSEQVRGFDAPSELQRQAMWSNTNNIKKFGRSFIWRVDL